MAKRKITQLDLFSGIGGFHLGFERAGYAVESYFSEIDKHAVAVYKHRFKNSTYVGSVTDVRGAELPRIDLITFGSPCQDFSLAGKRKGMQGERSSLVLEAIRLINECRPSVFIWENVKGTFSSNAGADFWAIIQAFTNIGGYRLEWQLLNTSWVLPQNRERVYLVGYSTTPGGDSRGVFPIGEASKKPIKRKTKIAAALQHPGHSGGNYRGMNMIVEANYTYENLNKTIEKNPQAFKEGEVKAIDCYNQNVRDIAPTLTAPEHNTTRIYDGRAQAYQEVKVKSATSKEAVVDPMIAAQRGRYQEDGSIKQELEINKEGKSNTLTAVQKDNMVVEPNYRIRRLTPIECERLQGFPDNHTEYGNYDGEVKKMSNTQRYKQCGNAVTVDIVALVAEAVKPLFK